MTIVTINQRCVYNRDGIQSFVHRGIILCDKIESERPDVIGFQEVTPKSITVLERLLPDYTFVGQFRSENFDVEGLFIAVRKDTCDVLGFETVWLSPTPYVPGSRFENQSNCPRICVEAKIRHRESGKIFRVYDLHLDHVSDEARLLGIKSAFEFIDSFKDDAPIVILGDFNAKPEENTMALCNSRSDIRDVTAHIPETFHGYGECEPMKIDYIYMSNELADKVKNTCIWDDQVNGIWLSDHYPVATEVEF